ncbi:MAG: FecR domain-containing protein [Alphaproteobacteria bacterium]|nr:FecR domain-containing protein [Alphaproteobacteria bacterium]
MTPADSAELDALLNRFVDSEAPAADDVHRLEALLRADAAARRRYRQFMALHGALAWDYASLARTAPAAPARKLIPAGAWLAAAGLAALLALVWLRPRALPRAASAAVVESVNGSVFWSDGARQQSQAVVAGAALDAGLVTADGENAAVQLRLADGTRLSLNGEAEVVLSAESAAGTVIGLRRGNLNASTGAPAGSSPASILTGAAEISLPASGAALNVSADAERTRVAVESGRAHLRRLADGTGLDLAPNHTAIATLDSRDRFAALPADEQPPRAWHRAFDRPPPAGSKGEWRSPADPGGPCVRAVPYVAGRRADGSPIVHHGITVRPVEGQGTLAALTRHTVLRVRWRTAQPASLQVFAGCKTAAGAFAGNFEFLARVERSPADAGGWRVSTVRIADFEPRAGKFPSPPPDALLGFLLLSTRETAADLEISEIILDSTDA